MRGILRYKLLDRDHESGDRSLHVGGAASEELSVALGGDERVAVPLLDRAGRHDVGVTHEADKGAGVAAPSPEIAHLAVPDRLERKSDPREPFGEYPLAAAVFRGDRAPRDQFAGKPQRRAGFNGRHRGLRWNRPGRAETGGVWLPASMLCALRLVDVAL